MAFDLPDKCANPACSCKPAKESRYCAPACEAEEQAADAKCVCGHAICEEIQEKAAEGLKPNV